MDDSLQIKCSRCRSVFRERARRLQNGFSRQCPTCEVVLFFDEDSQKPDIRRVMRRARQVRKELREAEMAALLGTPTPEAAALSYAGRQFAGRRRASAREE